MNNYNLKTYIFALNLYSIWGIISHTGIITHVCNWLQPIKLITMPSFILFWSFIVRVYIITQNKSQMLLEIKIHFYVTMQNILLINNHRLHLYS